MTGYPIEPRSRVSPAFLDAPAEADCCRGLAHQFLRNGGITLSLSCFICHSPWSFTVRSTRSSFKHNMATTCLKNVLFNRRLTASSIKSSRPSYLLRPCPAAQTRWSSATTEPRQPDADGGTKGGPSTQRYIKYTSESYASSPTLLSLALT